MRVRPDRGDRGCAPARMPRREAPDGWPEPAAPGRAWVGGAQMGVAQVRVAPVRARAGRTAPVLPDHAHPGARPAWAAPQPPLSCHRRRAVTQTYAPPEASVVPPTAQMSTS